jgi:Zn-finger nucleic acid-binding protein
VPLVTPPARVRRLALPGLTLAIGELDREPHHAYGFLRKRILEFFEQPYTLVPRFWAMDCLNCGAEMITNRVITTKDQISYEMCEKCGSLWLDSGELDKMAFKVDGSIEYCEQDKGPEPEQKLLKCPRCDDSILEKVKFLESDDLSVLPQT